MSDKDSVNSNWSVCSEFQEGVIASEPLSMASQSCTSSSKVLQNDAHSLYIHSVGGGGCEVVRDAKPYFNIIYRILKMGVSIIFQ